MESLLLILVLIGDPSGNDLAASVAAELTRLGGPQVRVVLGAPALERLSAKGITVQDLMVSPNIGAHLTQEQSLIVLHIDRSEKAGDVLVETRAWSDGRNDRHVAIAGAGGNPLPVVMAGIQGLIGSRLPGAAVPKAGGPDDTELASLTEHGRWLDILGRLAEIQARSPRQRYYEVLAYVKLGQRDAAVDALNFLRLEAPGHFLIAAAQELIPTLPATAPAEVPDAPLPVGDNVLRD